MLLILVDEVSERLSYTLDFILGGRSVPYRLTTRVDEYESDERGIRLNYSEKETRGGRTIRPAAIIHEKGFNSQLVEKAEYEGIECLSFNGQIDIIASVFYILTRYEEYDSEFKDIYGRFPFKDSVLCRNKWIEQAVCDRWARHLIELIDKDLYLDAVLRSALTSDKRKFIPSFDVDNTFAYQHKTGTRKLFSASRDLLNLDRKRLSERKAVNSGIMKDPYDTFDRISEVAAQFKNARIFWLTGSNGEKDRNLSIDIPEHASLIKKMAGIMTLGLHPTFDSFLKKGVIKEEKKKLEDKAGVKIDSSRQHYLRFRLPETYTELLSAGISQEFSMGFAEHVGFRCGTARAHEWFNIETNKRTSLVIHPFVYMDGSLREYMKLTLEESRQKVKELYEETKISGGDFVFIWHNETIGDYGNWKGWNELLDYTLTLANE